MYAKKPHPGKPKGKVKKKPMMMSKKGPMSSIEKKPSKNRMMYNDGGMIKAKPC
jgi:hypothetical protein